MSRVLQGALFQQVRWCSQLVVEVLLEQLLFSIACLSVVRHGCLPYAGMTQIRFDGRRRFSLPLSPVIRTPVFVAITSLASGPFPLAQQLLAKRFSLSTAPL